MIATTYWTLEVTGRSSVDVKSVDVKSLLQSLKALQRDKSEQDRYGSLSNQYSIQPSTYKKQQFGNRQQYYDKFAKQRKQRYDSKPPSIYNQLYDRNYDDSNQDDDRDEVTRILERNPNRQNGDSKQKLFNLKALQGLFGSETQAKYGKPTVSLMDSNEELLDLDKYSKIYVVLNPQALKRNRDVEEL